ELVNSIENAISNLTNWNVQYGVGAGGGLTDVDPVFMPMMAKHIKNLDANFKKVLSDDDLIYGTARGNALNTMLIWETQR
ncbi:MAG TPA: hypothetical protein PLZ51_29310, partial [Aggregatilineales bacterium]|nr:hypothetical protein [Aggregatilineales bacterium]